MLKTRFQSNPSLLDHIHIKTNSWKQFGWPWKLKDWTPKFGFREFLTEPEKFQDGSVTIRTAAATCILKRDTLRVIRSDATQVYCERRARRLHDARFRSGHRQGRR